MTPVVIERIEFARVSSTDNSSKRRYNVNNIWKDGKRPDDYDSKRKNTESANWIKKFHKDVPSLEIKGSDLYWIKEAARDNYLGKFSHIYDEDLQQTVEKYSHLFPQPPEKGWCVRTEYVSLKEGTGGAGPYFNLESILKSSVTSTKGHQPVKDEDEILRFYFLPWVQICNEFRVFVHGDKITALSPQIWFRRNKVDDLSDAALQDIVASLLDWFDKKVKDKLTYIGGDYTVDVAILEDNSWYFIEPNGFGGQYAAGSSSFHWEHDGDILTDSSKVHLRFVSKET